MALLNSEFERDIEDIAKIPIMATMLDVICKTTGMGFAAVARVTEDRWITCTAKDDIGFGLNPGDELKVKTTICNEIRDSGKPVIIDCVKEDPVFKNHHTPAMYGFQSYISVPIVRKNGDFFGTLCAIDPEPRELRSSAVMEMFNLFADLISFHLSTIDSVKETEEKLILEKAFTNQLEKKVSERTHELNEKNDSLVKINKELASFNYVSSHDMQEPLRKIQTISSIIIEKEANNLSDKGKDYFYRMQKSAGRMQALINDFLAYSQINLSKNNFEPVSLDEIINDVKNEYKDELLSKKAVIKASSLGVVQGVPFQFHQLFSNLIGNSIKFLNPHDPLLIKINNRTLKGKELHASLLPDTVYHHISVTDNGVGFEKQYSDKIFDLFQRLHDKTEYEGTGIGLTIVKKIVENHGGIIYAVGKVNEGASFDIYFPVQPETIS